jgi:hypothetical protein
LSGPVLREQEIYSALLDQIVVAQQWRRVRS